MTPTELELIQHAKSLGEHLREQMNTLLEIVRDTTTVYTKHAEYMDVLIKRLNEERDDANQKENPSTGKI